jgi:hypothetical protein
MDHPAPNNISQTTKQRDNAVQANAFNDYIYWHSMVPENDMWP